MFIYVNTKYNKTAYKKPILSSRNITLQWTEVLLLMFWPFQGPALGQNSIQRNSRFFSTFPNIYTKEIYIF